MRPDPPRIPPDVRCRAHTRRHGHHTHSTRGALVSADAAEQSLRAVQNARVALESAGAGLDDVISWTILIHQDADLRAAYGAVASTLARDGAPPLVTAALVAGLGVPGALIEVSAVAAVIRE